MTIPDIDRAAATDEEKLAWVKARAAAEPWHVAIGSVVQDMQLMGIPLKPDLIGLMMTDAMIGGERSVRDFTDGIGLGSIDREKPAVADEMEAIPADFPRAPASQYARHLRGAIARELLREPGPATAAEAETEQPPDGTVSRWAIARPGEDGEDGSIITEYDDEQWARVRYPQFRKSFGDVVLLRRELGPWRVVLGGEPGSEREDTDHG